MSGIIDRIGYASCYAYSPAGTDRVSERSRALCTALKSGDEQCIRRCAARVRQQSIDLERFAGYFDRGGILVPVPGSIQRAGARWIAERIAHALIEEGLGDATWPVLRRVSAVRKSATAIGGTRSSVRVHYGSLAVTGSGCRPRRVLLVDDVVTRGRTLLAAAARIHEAFPGTEVRAFALVRTIGLMSRLSRVMEPCTGEIGWWRGDARRRP
ncbi:MAG TPA: phosphoribosyltransferase [Steroidobacteraceae bacterium]|nr:phosphoribosyltransferase [Steroidobacteraceae bacterium]